MLSHPAVFIKTMNLLQCFKKSFSENMQVSAIDDTCEISEMFKIQNSYSKEQPGRAGSLFHKVRLID